MSNYTKFYNTETHFAEKAETDNINQYNSQTGLFLNTHTMGPIQGLCEKSGSTYYQALVPYYNANNKWEQPYYSSDHGFFPKIPLIAKRKYFAFKNTYNSTNGLKMTTSEFTGENYSTIYLCSSTSGSFKLYKNASVQNGIWTYSSQITCSNFTNLPSDIILVFLGGGGSSGQSCPNYYTPGGGGVGGGCIPFLLDLSVIDGQATERCIKFTLGGGTGYASASSYGGWVEGNNSLMQVLKTNGNTSYTNLFSAVPYWAIGWGGRRLAATASLTVGDITTDRGWGVITNNSNVFNKYLFKAPGFAYSSSALDCKDPDGSSTLYSCWFGGAGIYQSAVSATFYGQYDTSGSVGGLSVTVSGAKGINGTGGTPNGGGGGYFGGQGGGGGGCNGEGLSDSWGHAGGVTAGGGGARAVAYGKEGGPGGCGAVRFYFCDTFRAASTQDPADPVITEILAPVCDYDYDDTADIYITNNNSFAVNVYINDYYNGILEANSSKWYEVGSFEEYFDIQFELNGVYSDMVSAYSGYYEPEST